MIAPAGKGPVLGKWLFLSFYFMRFAGDTLQEVQISYDSKPM